VSNRVVTSVAPGQWVQTPSGPARRCKQTSYVNKSDAKPEYLADDSYRKLCAAQGLVVEVAGNVKYDDRTPQQKKNDGAVHGASTNSGDNMAKKDLMSIDALEGLFEGTDRGFSAVDMDKLKDFGIALGAGGLSGAALAAGLPFIPDLPGHLNLLKALIPAALGGAVAWFLWEENLPMATMAIGAGGALSGVMAVTHFERSMGATVWAKEAAPEAVETISGGRLNELMGLLAGPSVRATQDFEGFLPTPVQSFEGGVVNPTPEFAGVFDENDPWS